MKKTYTNRYFAKKTCHKIIQFIHSLKNKNKIYFCDIVFLIKIQIILFKNTTSILLEMGN